MLARVRARPWHLALAIAFPVACRSGSASRDAVEQAPATSAVAVADAAPAPPAASVSEVASSSRTPRPDASPVPSSLDLDAGARSCRVVRGPIELPVRGAVGLIARGDEIACVQNEDGRARVTRYPAPPIASSPTAPPPTEPAASGVSAGLAVGCAWAGSRIFCPDRSGAVHRVRPDGSDDRIVASSRSGSRVAGASVAPDRTVLAYLASRKTSEGWVSEAWLAVDDEPPARLSEDGSGATSVALADHAGGVVAVTVDARTALTAMHARSLALDAARDGGVHLGEDTVVFVGGPGDRRTGAALAVTSPGSGWSLLPIAKDVGSFGLAVVRIESPPRVEEPVTWSMYPNGLDPAPVAAVSSGSHTWVARVLPQSADVGATHVLQLGRVDEQGAFAALDRVPTSGNVKDVALAVDSRGALWVGWLDASGAWLERLQCR
jgi:hypothetical protein